MAKTEPDASGELVIYPGKDGQLRVQSRMKGDTLWLTQKQMAELFGVQLPAISKHLKNIFETGELAESSVVSILESTAADGKTYATGFYNLDAVIAVGYRVNSVLATHFRIWATQVLREYIVKGFALDDERLKNPPVAGSATPDHFAEMLERVRDIRASERRIMGMADGIHPIIHPLIQCIGARGVGFSSPVMQGGFAHLRQATIRWWPRRAGWLRPQEGVGRCTGPPTAFRPCPA